MVGVHCWADLQSVHGFRCYENIARTRNTSEWLYSLYACLKHVSAEKLTFSILSFKKSLRECYSFLNFKSTLLIVFEALCYITCILSSDGASVRLFDRFRLEHSRSQYKSTVIFCIAANPLVFCGLYMRKLLRGRHLNWTIDFSIPLCTMHHIFDGHAAEMQRTCSEFTISFFSRESLWLIIYGCYVFFFLDTLDILRDVVSFGVARCVQMASN